MIAIRTEELATDEAPRADHDASIAFLKKKDPNGPWVLTAILTRKKGAVTRPQSFGDDSFPYATGGRRCYQ